MARHSQLVRCDSLKAKTFRSKLFRSANASAKDLGLNVKTIRLIENGTPVRLSKVQQYAERLGVSIDELLHDHVEPSDNNERIVASPTSSELFNFPISSGLYTQLTLKKAVAHACNNETLLSIISNGGARLDNQLIGSSPIDCSPVWLLAEGTDSSPELADELAKLLVQINKALKQNTSTLESLISKIQLKYFTFIRTVTDLSSGFCLINRILNVESSKKYERIQLKSINKKTLIESSTNRKCTCT